MKNYEIAFSTGLVVGVKALNVMHLQDVTDKIALSLNYYNHSLTWKEVSR